MRPIAVITLIVLGSCFAIMTSLAGVIIVVLVLGDEYPRLQTEFDSLLGSLGIFVILTALSALSFYSLLKNHAARYWMHASMWTGILLAGRHYWP